MRRALRWLKRFVLTLLVLVTASVIAVLIALHTSWGRGKLRAYIEDQLAARYPGSHVGTLEGSVLGTVTLRDVRIGDLATVGTVDVELALLPLLEHTARIDRLRADDVHVTARKPPPAPGGQGEPSRWDVELSDVAIHHATIDVAGETIEAELHGGGFVPAGEPPRFTATIAGHWRSDFTAFAGVELGDTVRLPFVLGTFAGATVAATDALVDADQPEAVIAVSAPATAIALVAPRYVPPGDVRATATARGGHLDATAIVGTASLHVALDGRIESRVAVGDLEAIAPDLAAVTAGRVSGGATVSATFTALRDRISGTAFVHGDLPRVPAHDAVIAFDATCARTAVFARATGDDDLLAYASAIATCNGEIASAITATGRRAALVTGELALDAEATGTLWPLALDVSGTTHDREVVLGDLRAARVDGPLAAKVTPSGVLGTATLDLSGVARKTTVFGNAHVVVANRADDTWDVAATGRPQGIELFARGHVVPGTTTTIELAEHRIALPTGAWTGRGGTLTIAPAAVKLRGLVTHRDASAIAARMDLDRATGELGATFDLPQVAAEAFDPALRGTAHGTLAIHQRAGRWSGSSTLDVAGFATTDGVPVDGTVAVSLAGRTATLDVHADARAAGSADATLAVTAPSDPTDVRAWLRLDRDAIRTAKLALHHVDGTPFGRAGTVDGVLDLAPHVLAGTLAVAGVATPLGTVAGDVTLTPRDGDLGANATARLAGIGDVSLAARFAVPEHPFDPATWRALGRGVIREAAADLDDVAFDPQLFARFGIHEPLRGRATIELALGKAAAEAKLGIDLENVTGAGLVAPIAEHIAIAASSRGTHVDATTCAKPGCTLALGALHGDVPMTLDRWLAEPRAILQAPVTATWTLDRVGAPDVLALFGRTELRAGELDGRATLRGTVATPIVDRAELVAHDIVSERSRAPVARGRERADNTASERSRAPVARGRERADNNVAAPRFGGQPPPALHELSVVATWGGAAGTLTVTGGESATSTLRGWVSGRPGALAALTGGLHAAHFDLAPVAALLPDAVAGLAGIIDADLGLASGARFSGRLDVIDGKLPVGSAVGTLRDATAHVELGDRTVTARADAKLGAGTVHLEADADPAGTTTHAKLVLTHVSPIGVLQPIIDATVHGTLVRDGATWRGDLRVSDARVRIPQRTGTKLLDASTPGDLHVGPQRTASSTHEVAHPTLVASIVIDRTPITARDLVEGIDVRAEASSKHLELVAGDSVALTGVVDLAGSSDVFGRAYELGASTARFDGGFDPWIDITMTHEFTDLVLTATFVGPASKPVAHFASQPGGYSEGQLLGFFVGGEPGGDSSTQTREAAEALAAAIVSARVSREVNRVLPVHVEASCAPESSAASRSCTLGHWFTPHLFASVRGRANPRPDENQGEGFLQWYLGRNVLIEVVGGSHGGGDLLWRRRW